VNSCPNCDAPAPAGARACEACGYRFLEDGRPGRALLAGAAIAALVLAGVLLLGGGRDSGQEPATGPALEILSNHPLSRRAAERRLETRFSSTRDDDSAAARCSALEPRPAHAVRRCRIRYPNGSERTVVVLLDARGRERLSED
jgi:ribosomal protein L40E